MSQIFRNLPDNQYQAAINANSPSATNPFLTASALTALNAYAAYHTNPYTSIQTTAPNTPTPMRYEIIDFEYGITLNTTTNDKFVVDANGIYDIQFSAQLDKSGGTESIAYIWPEVNNVPVSGSNSSITLANNGHRIVAAWNWMLSLSAGDEVKIMWTSTTGSIELVNEVPLIGPEIPAVIVTIQKIA